MLNNYGVLETNPLLRTNYHEEMIEDISWDELKEKKDICAERIRFVTDNNFPFWDLSYFHIRINNVKYRVLNSPFEQVSKKNFKSTLYNILKKENIYIRNFFQSISQLY